MPAKGGPTNQSGVGYQNAVAALYVGRLCDATKRPPHEAVRSVRVESVGVVDDIEVEHVSGARRWIHAKERIDSSSGEWTSLWKSFVAKRSEVVIERGDRLALWLGMPTRAQEALAEAAKRARNATDHDEWSDDLSQEQVAAVRALETVVGFVEGDGRSFDLLRVVDITMTSRERLLDLVPYWIPAVRSLSREALYDVFQAKVIEGARYRKVFVKPGLLEELRVAGVDLVGALPDVERYRASVQARTSWMGIPGTAIGGPTKQVFREPRLRTWAADRFVRKIDEDFVEEVGERVQFEELPGGSGSRTVIIGGAGAGKSALAWSLTHRLASSAWVPALVPLVELARSGEPVGAFLETAINKRHSVAIDWLALCESGAAVLVFDGLDELSQDARSTTLDAISDFSARFPLVPWIMTVRDLAGTAAPPGAQVVEVQPLRLEDVETFCRGWIPAEKQGLAARVAAVVAVNPELRRMARIPFLLALITDYAITHADAVPARRTELLEQYLRALLRPGKHKPAQIEIDAFTLRDAAERIAFLALDAGETDVAARSAADLLGETGPAILDALVTSGLLREYADRYAFTFPILQEYLAGYFIAVRRRDEIIARFDQETSRPWTQALQFAVEVIENAEPIVAHVLASADDAFRTNLKIIGRCVANGARIASEMRARVGDQLAAQWIAEDRDGTRTGQLLADGYSKALPGAAAERVRRGEQLEHGGAAIIVAADDPALTEAALQSELAVGFPGHVYAWQSAIDRIAVRAATLYIGRAATARTPSVERERHWIAYLLARVARVSSENDPRNGAARDPHVDVSIRLASLLRVHEADLPQDAEPLVIDAFRRYVAVETEGASPALDVIFDAMFRLPRATETWRNCLDLLETTPLFAQAGVWWLFGLEPAEAYWRTTVFAIVGRRSATDARRLIAELAALPNLPATRQDYLDLVLAFLDDDDAFARLEDRLDSVHWRDIGKWLHLASRRGGSQVAKALLKLKRIQSAHRRDLATNIGFAFTHEVELQGLTGGARGVARRRHAASDAAVELLRAWGDEAPVGSVLRFKCMGEAVRVGAVDVAPTVLRELEARLDAAPLDFDTDHAMADALSALAETRVAIPQSLLERAARASQTNLAFRAFTQIELERTTEALDLLLSLHAESDKQKRASLTRHIERLAIATGARIDRDASGRLTRREPAESAP